MAPKHFLVFLSLFFCCLSSPLSAAESSSSFSDPDLWVGGRIYMGYVDHLSQNDSPSALPLPSGVLYSGYVGIYGRSPLTSSLPHQAIADLNMGFSNVHGLSHPFAQHLRAGLQGNTLGTLWTVWGGRMLNGASEQHLSLDPPLFQGVGLDNQPLCALRQGCFTTNIASKAVTPYANRLLLQGEQGTLSRRRPSERTQFSLSYTPLTMGESHFAEDSFARTRSHHEISIGASHQRRAAQRLFMGMSGGYTYDNEGEHQLQGSLRGIYEALDITLSGAQREGLIREQRWGLQTMTYLEDDEVIHFSLLTRFRQGTQTTLWEIGTEIPIVQGIWLAFSVQNRLEGGYFTAPIETSTLFAVSSSF